MKQWLSYLLILIFSFQALPVKELGKLLIKKSLTEQAEDGADETPDSPKPVKEKEMEKMLSYTQVLPCAAIIIDEQVKVALHNLRIFQAHFHPEITTPPPDFGFC